MRGERLEHAYCNGWESDQSQAVGSASALLVKSRLLNYDDQSFTCNNAFILLCIENSYSVDQR